jgi:hypothetical protein
MNFPRAGTVGRVKFTLQLSQELASAEGAVGGFAGEFEPTENSDPDLTTINTFIWDIDDPVACPASNPSPGPSPRSLPQPQPRPPRRRQPDDACENQLTRNTITLLDEFQTRGRLTVQEITSHVPADNRRIYDSLSGLIHTGMIRRCHREKF